MKISIKDLKFVINSLIIDFEFLKISKWNLSLKLLFLYKKYFLLAKHSIINFKLGISEIKFNNKSIFYSDKYGLADYQSILVRHQKMLQISNIDNIKNVLDVGANVGFFSMLINELYPKANIYCFEPVKETFDVLLKNTAGNNKIHCFMSALSDKNSKLRMKVNSDNSVANHVSKSGDILVNTVTLDSFCKENKISKIDVLKIDVEGWENFVLKGGKKMLPFVNLLFLEITIKDNDNYTLSSIFSELYDKNYNFQLIAFRNYADVSFGEMPIMDTLLKNTLIDNK